MTATSVTATSLKSQFLISMPTLRGDYFQSSVTLLIEHNDEGAFGLVINKPTDLMLGDLIEDLEHNPLTVMSGGPVEQDRLFFLHSPDCSFDESVTINDEIVITTSPDLIDAIASAEGPSNLLALLGYAGWGPGQLDDEILRDAWLVVPFDAELLFSLDFADKPQRAAAMMGVDLNLISPTPGHG